MERIDTYKLLEKAAIEIAMKLEGLVTTQMAVRVTIENESGQTIDTALRIIFPAAE